MPDRGLDLDLLARHLRSKMCEDKVSLREAAQRIGVSPATVTRLLKGKDSPNDPDLPTVQKAASWVGKSVGHFEIGKAPSESTLADVEVHLRALKGLNQSDREALIAMVRAAYDAADQLRAKEESGG